MPLDLDYHYSLQYHCESSGFEFTKNNRNRLIHLAGRNRQFRQFGGKKSAIEYLIEIDSSIIWREEIGKYSTWRVRNGGKQYRHTTIRLSFVDSSRTSLFTLRLLLTIDHDAHLLFTIPRHLHLRRRRRRYQRHRILFRE